MDFDLGWRAWAVGWLEREMMMICRRSRESGFFLDFDVANFLFEQI